MNVIPFNTFLMSIDLHTHSNMSDGQLSPSELVHYAAECGVTLLSLTDHDTMDGTHLAARTAEEVGIGFINGVEVSMKWGGKIIHIVGLGMDPDSATVDAFFRDVCVKRDQRGRMIGERLEALGIFGAYEGALSLAGNKDNLSRTHFAHWLWSRGHVKNYQEAFDRYLRSGRPANVDVAWPTLEQALELIHNAGGIAVVAHPGRYCFSEDWMILEFLKEFKALGGRAIEVSSGSQSRADDERFAQIAREMDFLASTGSDWHSERSGRPAPGTQPQLAPGLIPVWECFGY